MPTYKVKGCVKTFTQCPGASEFVLAHYRTKSIKDLAIATGVAYANVAEFLRRRGLLADRYTTKAANVRLAEKLTTHELAYLAGIIDGEGTITVQVRGLYARPCVSIANTSTLLKQWLQDRGFDPHMAMNSSKRWYWRIHWSGYPVDRLLQLVRPYLIIKAAHADLLHEFISIRRSQSKRRPLTDRMLEIAAIIRWLNERKLALSEREKRDGFSILSPNITSSPWAD